MSSHSLERMLSEHPEWRAPLAVLERLIAETRGKRVAHPEVLAKQAGLPITDTLAFLHILSKAGRGSLRVRIVDPNGIEVRRFSDIGEVPNEVEDDFGHRIEVTPENTELVFVGK